jgi:hypothetical protein
MPITSRTSDAAIAKAFNKGIDDMQKAIIRLLQYVGERAVNEARNLFSPSPTQWEDGDIPPHQPNYIDWTANLRSSIGYIVIHDGQVIEKSDFTPIKTGGQGAKTGAEYAKRIATQFQRGFILVVVAGMEYAEYVAHKGYDVLDSAEILAIDLAKRLFNQLKKNGIENNRRD